MLNQPGMQLASDTSDSYDARNFPSSQYPYAFEVFGNNGSTPRGGVATSSSNNSLQDLANASTVLGDIQQFGSGSTSTGSDHYPVVGDYTLMFPGDFNRNGHVDASDIVAMENALTNLPAYQTAMGLSSAQLLAMGDLNGDGVVNNADLQALLNLLKSGGGSSDAVPEPSGLTLIVLAISAVALTRRSR